MSTDRPSDAAIALAASMANEFGDEAFGVARDRLIDAVSAKRLFELDDLAGACTILMERPTAAVEAEADVS